jgi:hypothetical protein
MTRVIPVCFALWCALATASAHAQATPQWLHVRWPLLASSSMLAESTPRTAASAAVQFRQNRARRILGAGIGFVLSAAVTPAYVSPHRQPCWGSDERKGGLPLKLAAGVAAVGLVGLAGGATWLTLESRRHGRVSSRRQRMIAAGIGTLTFALGQALLGSAFFVDQICSS